MSSGPTVPARTTVADLARAIGLDLDEVQAALTDRSEGDALDEPLDAEATMAIAEALGKTINIEPRDLALEILYEADTNGLDPVESTGRTQKIVDGVSERREDMDMSIEKASEHWSVARMPVVDRSILRIGLYELLEEDDIPTAVIVSEAVRLADAYSTERSGAFVNGVLAALAREVRA